MITEAVPKPILSKPEAIMHPLRHRILIALQGRELTPQQISRSLPDIPQASLYRHLNRLAEAGIIHVVALRPAGGTTERVWAVVPGAADMTAEEVKHASRDDLLRYFTAFVGGVLGVFEQYTRQPEPPHFERDGVAFYNESVYLTDDEAQASANELRQLLRAKKNHPPGANRKRHLLAIISVPDPASDTFADNASEPLDEKDLSQ